RLGGADVLVRPPPVHEPGLSRRLTTRSAGAPGPAPGRAPPRVSGLDDLGAGPLQVGVAAGVVERGEAHLPHDLGGLPTPVARAAVEVDRRRAVERLDPCAEVGRADVHVAGADEVAVGVLTG